MDYLIPADVIAAAAEAMDAEAVRCLGRDLGTVHRDDIAAAALGAALAAGLLAALAPTDREVDDFVVDELAAKLRHAYNGATSVTEQWRYIARIALAQRIPAAPADDEAAIERMARASWYASDGFITGLPWPVTGFRAEKERRRVRGALAAYLGQPWYVGQEIEWNPTGDEWTTGFITRLSGDNAGITLHDNAQPLTVSTRNLRSALAALREGQ